LGAGYFGGSNPSSRTEVEMKYLNKKYKKREKLVDQYLRLLRKPYHTKTGRLWGNHIILEELRDKIWKLGVRSGGLV
jgi:hypothetical protein